MIDILPYTMKTMTASPNWVVRKTHIVLAGLYYPFAILSYFRHALEKRPDVELFTVGAYTGDQIPWNGGMRLPMKYVKTVDLPLPPAIIKPSWKLIERNLPWAPDLVLCVDAGFHFLDKPNFPYAVIGTDPHVLNANGWYNDVRPKADWFFNMQRYYMVGDDIHLPYACSPDHHYPMSDIDKFYDASLIGLHYLQRNQLVQALRNKGYKVIYNLGLIYDEYREQNNRAVCGLNWSNLMDINARIFEIMAMKQVPVINRLPHLDELGLFENEHYLGFDTVQEGVEKVEWALANPEKANAIALCAHNLVRERHTYELRCEQILKTVGLL